MSDYEKKYWEIYNKNMLGLIKPETLDDEITWLEEAVGKYIQYLKKTYSGSHEAYLKSSLAIFEPLLEKIKRIEAKKLVR